MIKKNTNTKTPFSSTICRLSRHCLSADKLTPPSCETVPAPKVDGQPRLSGQLHSTTPGTAKVIDDEGANSEFDGYCNAIWGGNGEGSVNKYQLLESDSFFEDEGPGPNQPSLERDLSGRLSESAEKPPTGDAKIAEAAMRFKACPSGSMTSLVGVRCPEIMTDFDSVTEGIDTPNNGLYGVQFGPLSTPLRSGVFGSAPSTGLGTGQFSVSGQSVQDQLNAGMQLGSFGRQGSNERLSVSHGDRLSVPHGEALRERLSSLERQESESQSPLGLAAMNDSNMNVSIDALVGAGVPIRKFTCRFEIQIDNDKDFFVARRIIGQKGSNMKKIVRACESEVKLRLRGRGSGFLEGPLKQESSERLHLCVSCKDYEGYSTAVKLVRELLAEIYTEYAEYCRRGGCPKDSEECKPKDVVCHEQPLFFSHPAMPSSTPQSATSSGNATRGAMFSRFYGDAQSGLLTGGTSSTTPTGDMTPHMPSRAWPSAESLQSFREGSGRLSMGNPGNMGIPMHATSHGQRSVLSPNQYSSFHDFTSGNFQVNSASFNQPGSSFNHSFNQGNSLSQSNFGNQAGSLVHHGNSFAQGAFTPSGSFSLSRPPSAAQSTHSGAGRSSETREEPTPQSLSPQGSVSWQTVLPGVGSFVTVGGPSGTGSPHEESQSAAAGGSSGSGTFQSLVYAVPQMPGTERGLLSESEIEKLVKERNEARRVCNFRAADAIRDYLKAHGVGLMDEPGGRGDAKDVTTWRVWKGL